MSLIKKEETIFKNSISDDLHKQSYSWNKENINATFRRVAKEIASVEVDKVYWEEVFYNMLQQFKFVPGGRILSNAGTGLEGTSLINCFVDGFIGEDQDSMGSIMDALRRQAFILKSEGGYGFCSDVLRPRGCFIEGIGNDSCGAVRMLDMWDTQANIITEGSNIKKEKKNKKDKIRKGAQMVTMSVYHPDIEEFIKAKQTEGRLTKFNMSVLISDSFMYAVENNLPWKLIFPDIENNKIAYKKYWDGNIEKWINAGYSVNVYKTYDNANTLWDLLMKSTYNRNEPGVLFEGTINRLNNLKYCEYIKSTNPCGEQPLPIGSLCLLGSINLTQFIDFKNKTWDYKQLESNIPNIIRFMDNVNDITYVPFEHQKQALKDKRRLGLGVMGYASALVMLKVRYGSEKALQMTTELYEFISNLSYKFSALLAKEKGSFGLYNEELYLQSEYLKVLKPETIDYIKKYGIRNSHLLNVAPTGNTAILAEIVSGGFEPMFMPIAVRTIIVTYAPDGIETPTVDWINKKFTNSSTDWKWIKEGDTNMLKYVLNDVTYKYDKSRGLLKEIIVMDYGVNYLKKLGELDTTADYYVDITTLTLDDHINTMKVFAKYVDAALSKTINLPNDFSYEDFKNVYMDLYKTGVIKGATTYRIGTMASVLSAIDKKDDDNDNIQITKTTAPKRPKTLKCNIHHTVVKGENWIVLVGMLSDEPFEVFAFKNNNNLSDDYKEGNLIRIKKNHYNLKLQDLEIDNIAEKFETDEQEALTRLISCSLRHGADINFIYDMLEKSKGALVTFSKAIARTLKKYLKEKDSKELCPSCSTGILIRQEGCFICQDCNYSKC